MPASPFRCDVLFGAPGDGINGSLASSGRPLISYGAWAACTDGKIVSDADMLGDDLPDMVIILHRPCRHAHCMSSLRYLQDRGVTTGVCIQEAGMSQIQHDYSDPQRFTGLVEIMRRVDFAVFSSASAKPIGEVITPGRCHLLSPPIPMDDPRWNYLRTAPEGCERGGILVGTRQMHITSRNHLHGVFAAVSAARDLDVPVTLIERPNQDLVSLLKAVGGVPIRPARPHESLHKLGFMVRYHLQRITPHLAYLDELRKHKVVFQMDGSAVPGRVAADAVLADIPVVGGNGTNEQIAYPDLPHDPMHASVMVDETKRLFLDEGYFDSIVSKARMIATQKLSYAAGREALLNLHHTYSPIVPNEGNP